MKIPEVAIVVEFLREHHRETSAMEYLENETGVRLKIKELEELYFDIVIVDRTIENDKELLDWLDTSDAFFIGPITI